MLYLNSVLYLIVDTKVLPDVTADEENMLSAVTARDEDGDL